MQPALGEPALAGGWVDALQRSLPALTILCAKKEQRDFFYLSSLKLLAEMDGVVSTALLILTLVGISGECNHLQPFHSLYFSVSFPLLTLSGVTGDPSSSLALTYAPGRTHVDADECH